MGNRRPNGSGTCLAVLVALLLAVPAFALEGRNVEFHGFFLGSYAGRTTGERPSGAQGGDFLLGEERLRLDLTTWSESVEASATVRAEFIHDGVAEASRTDLREVYADYATGPWDLRLGRQIATWGVGDLLFINDVFPKDWVSFFAGRPLGYLKNGVDGLRARRAVGGRGGGAELFVVPFFTPDVLPDGNRFVLSDPFPGVTDRTEQTPPATYGNTELALRLFGRLAGFDVAAYAYRGHWGAPAMRPDDFAVPTQVTIFHPALSVYGASAQGNALGGVLSLEAGYYDSRDDRAGTDPAVPNDQARVLAGYQRQLWEDFTLGAQYYAEVMADHGAYRRVLPAGFPAVPRYRDTLTLRLEQRLMHQALRLSLFAFYGRAEDDWLLQPQVAYRFSDEWSATVGANLFGGEDDTTFLGQFDRNDNIYLSVRVDF